MDRLALEVERHAESHGAAEPLVCASGISPSGPIHMGNLREVFTTHLVVEALRERGRKVVHLHSWDDYDRFRKVPAGVDPSFAEHIGKPLAEVPDPWGEFESYGARFIEEFTSALAAIGIEITPVRQSERYPRGDYNAEIRKAMDDRELVFDTLASQQTAGRHDKPLEERRREYYPFKPYCTECRKDDTRVVGYGDESVAYTCKCGHAGEMSLADGAAISGKLVWKVDWPMRWAREAVVFEPAGEDHHAPTGSFTVGRTFARELYGWQAPASAIYSFVTMAGANGKMSSSAGGAAVLSTALDVIEPAIVRWLYTRRLPNQSFAIDLGPQAVQRLYDEWDRFAAKVADGTADPVDARMHAACVRTTAGEVGLTGRPVSFRLLGSAADITQGNPDQIARIVTQHLETSTEVPPPARLLAELEPRLTCAVNWATKLLDPEQRTVIRTEFDQEKWDSLDEQMRDGVQMLADGLAGSWNLDDLTTLVYSVPKRMAGLEPDAKPNAEVKTAQREFFKVLYRLLVSSDTGPRLPTLMLSLGPDKTKSLLLPG